MNDIANPQSLLDELTEKQREVLDLLIQHKTSKEISRDLGISPHTVDQRIMLARAKMKVGSRNEVAQIYSRLLTGADRDDARLPAYGQTVYQFSDVADSALPHHTVGREGGAGKAQARSEPAIGAGFGAGADRDRYYHVLPEMFDGPHGTLLRLGAMALISILVILVGLGGLSMFAQLSMMFDR
ncbi:helix-turn-helix transcriptional regulator [Novosphingobium sp. ZN18A2]|uniref:helix-turn-helix transcriptional regulator n=1 Tax=Novosphingobium sp. ZN18A2 TaxID=3079861 RepID=UPI0030CE94D7